VALVMGGGLVWWISWFLGTGLSNSRRGYWRVSGGKEDVFDGLIVSMGISCVGIYHDYVHVLVGSWVKGESETMVVVVWCLGLWRRRCPSISWEHGKSLCLLSCAGLVPPLPTCLVVS
jgi:hypothetical protein